MRGLASYQEQLDALKEAGLNRQCRTVEPQRGMRVLVDGVPAINFSSNDYLGLSQDVRLQEASIQAIQQYGTGSASSRLISGTNHLMTQLEHALCEFKQTEAALVFNSGYQANVAILQALLEPTDWLFADKLNHASLVDGCRLSNVQWTRYKHLDLEHLESKLKKAPADARKWIATDSVFSMDGDFPDLEALVSLAERYEALILIDEAHATGLYGDAKSSGLCEHFGVSDRIALQMGTFSKALGGAGAYVAGSKLLIQTLVNRARGFIYSTAMSPAVVGAGLKAVEVVQQDPPLKQRLWGNVRLFESLASQAGLASVLPSEIHSPIIPVFIGESSKAVAVSQALLGAGYFVQGIRPPTVPPKTARLRIALSAAHQPEDIAGLVSTLSNVLESLL